LKGEEATDATIDEITKILFAVEFSSNKISIVGVTEMGVFWGWQCKDLRNSRRKLATLGRKIRHMMGSS
jgi:hypothetical protein